MCGASAATKHGRQRPTRAAQRGLLACCALLCWLLRAALGPAPLHAQAGAYVPVNTDLLLRGRPAEGLLVLRSGYRNSPFVDADALVFVGAGTGTGTADVLTASVGVRAPSGVVQAQLGRFMLSTGAVRPVQIDGVRVLTRPLSDTTVELFGGSPVMPALAGRNFDWLVGGRVAQRLLDRLTLGASYMQRRHAGQLDGEELGCDLGFSPSDWLTISGLSSWDVLTNGLAEARGAAVMHGDAMQLELFASRRLSARMLPATSLFSVIGNPATSELAAALSWQLFPRLLLGSSGGALELDRGWGYRAAVFSRLKLSDTDNSALRVEAMRRKLGVEGYTGASLRLDVPLSAWVRPYVSAELVAADAPRGRGNVWPWLRAGASYSFGPWLLAAAAGFRATPLYQRELQALVNLAYAGVVQP